MKYQKKQLAPVIETTISKATKMLDAAGCAWAVKRPDGRVIGTPETFAGKKRTNLNFAKLGYRKKIAAMKPGDVEVFKSPDPKKTRNYRASIGSYAWECFGPGNYTTVSNGDTIELLCTGTKEPDHEQAQDEERPGGLDPDRPGGGFDYP